MAIITHLETIIPEKGHPYVDELLTRVKGPYKFQHLEGFTGNSTKELCAYASNPVEDRYYNLKDINPSPVLETLSETLFSFELPFRNYPDYWLVPTEQPSIKTVFFKYFEGSDPTKLILINPGWGEDSQLVTEPLCRELSQLGIPSAYLIPPFQGIRTLPKEISGERLISFDLVTGAPNLGRWRDEFLSLANYFVQRGMELHLVGISAGGFASSGLVGNPDLQPKTYTNIVSGGLLGSIVMKGRLTKIMRERFLKEGIDTTMLNHILSPYDPLRYKNQPLSANKVYSLVGLNDLIVPTIYQTLWASYFSEPSNIKELELGHASLYFSRDTIRDLLYEIANSD